MASDESPSWTRLPTDLSALVLFEMASARLLGTGLSPRGQAIMIAIMAAGLLLIQGIRVALGSLRQPGWKNFPPRRGPMSGVVAVVRPPGY